MNVIFMGTPEFSVPTLEKLYEAGHNIQLVVTQPDKPAGRGKKLKKSEVKEKAEKLGLNVFQPDKIKKSENIDVLQSYDADVIVVVAYGQILSKEILNIPKYGCINVHASLLPKLRGAAPLNWAIINGDTIAGVTTMQMDVGLDTGCMLLKDMIDVTKDMNAGQLHDILMMKGADLLIDTLKAIEENRLNPIEQNEAQSTYAPMLNKTMAKINWNDTAENVHNKVRGLYPWPCAYFIIDSKPVKVYETSYIEEKLSYEPGYVYKVDEDGIYVATSKGAVIIKELQMPGKNRMKVNAYLRGNKFTHIQLQNNAE